MSTPGTSTAGRPSEAARRGGIGGCRPWGHVRLVPPGFRQARREDQLTSPRASRNRWVLGIGLTGGLVQLGLGMLVILDVSGATSELRRRWFSGEAFQTEDAWLSLSGNRDAILDGCFWCPYKYYYLWGIWLVVMGLWLAIRRDTWDWWMAAWGLFLGFDIMSDTLSGILLVWVIRVDVFDYGTFGAIINFLFSTSFSNVVSLIASGLLGVGVWLIARRFFLAKGSPPADADTTAPDSQSPPAPEGAAVPSGEPMNPAPVSRADGCLPGQ